jgi:outer membrane cobalamin receptor
VLLVFAAFVAAWPWPTFGVAAGTANDTSATPSPGDAHAASDSVYTLAPIVVDATRIQPGEELLHLPGQMTYVEIAPVRSDLTDVAEVLESLPGLHVRNYGSAGHFSSASIRGASAAQVSVYLDGVPLTRAGNGVTNLADLPFAGIDHIEVYRGFAPPGLPGSGMGGAIHLVSRPTGETPRNRSSVAAAAGSFGGQRLGLTQHVAATERWDMLFVADIVQIEGNFEFLDDNGTPLNNADDERAVRRNNWVQRHEFLAKAGRQGGSGTLNLLHHWVGREQGVAGIPSDQSEVARLGTRHHLTSATWRLPPLFDGGLQVRTQLFHDWRRDWFKDREDEVGLGYQDNNDTSHALGAHLESIARVPWLQHVAFYVDARGETFTPHRRYPLDQHGPAQSRTTLQATFENRLLLAGDRLHLQTVVRATREGDSFTGDLRTPYSRGPAESGQREYVEPRLGARLRLLPGVYVEASYGQHHRSPGFLELFGDGGSVAGSSDLVAEEGVNRDYGVEVQQRLGGVVFRAEVAHFDNRVDQLITYLPQSQRTFVARNIGSARMQGEEFLWRIVHSREWLRWRVEGNYTQQRTEDLGVDILWYAGKTLPGRPEQQFYSRFALELGPLGFAYRYEHMGLNFLDRWNRKSVEQRDLHGADFTARLRRVSLRLAVRNLTNDQAQDVAAFPVPGRTFSVSSNVRF